MHITASHQTCTLCDKKEEIVNPYFFQYEYEQPLSKLFLKCEN